MPSAGRTFRRGDLIAAYDSTDPAGEVHATEVGRGITAYCGARIDRVCPAPGRRDPAAFDLVMMTSGCATCRDVLLAELTRP